MVQVSDMVKKVKPGWKGFPDLRPPDEHMRSSRGDPRVHLCSSGGSLRSSKLGGPKAANR